jgi:hypothetical protein
MASLFVLPVVTGMLLEIIMQVIGTVDNEVTQAVQRSEVRALYWLAFTFSLHSVGLHEVCLDSIYADMLFLFNASYVQIPYEQEFVAEVLQQKAPWQVSGVRN